MKKYNYRLKQILSILLIFAMVVTLTPDSVLAHEKKTSDASTEKERITAKEYSSNGCSITYRTTANWGNNAVVEVSVTNGTTRDMDIREITFDYKAKITNIWNAIVANTLPNTDSGYNNFYTIKPETYNATIKSSETMTFGYLAESSAGTPKTPQNVHVEGDFYNEKKKEPDTREETILGGKYKVTATVTSAWSGHITGEITIENNGKEPLEDWKFTFPWDAEITNMWNGKYHKTGSGYVISPMEYNAVINPGGTVVIGFQAAGTNSSLASLENSGFFGSQNVSLSDGNGEEHMLAASKPVPTITPTEKPQVVPVMPETSQNPSASNATRIPDIHTVTEVPVVTEDPGAAVTPEKTNKQEETESPNETESPKNTKVPVETETSGNTETPKETKTPKNTEVPRKTDAPGNTETPSNTDAPKKTSLPKTTGYPVIPSLEPPSPVLPELVTKTPPVLAPKSAMEMPATVGGEPWETTAPATVTSPTAVSTPAAVTSPSAIPPITIGTPEPTEEPAEDFHVNGNIILDTDLECNNLYIHSGSLNVNGKKLPCEKMLSRPEETAKSAAGASR